MHLTLTRAKLTATGQRYHATLDGEVIATSRQPFYAAARALQAQGYDDEIVLTASHEGSVVLAMRSTIGRAAVWSVSEGERTGLAKVEFQERPRGMGGAPPAHDSAPDPVSATPGEAARVFERPQR